MLGLKLIQPLPQKKLTQDLVAGNPKSVIRQKPGVKRRLVLMHLKKTAATPARIFLGGIFWPYEKNEKI